jgi:hypothetical protein
MLVLLEAAVLLAKSSARLAQILLADRANP